MFWWKRNRNHLLVILLLLVICLPVILPLLHRGFFQTDDGEWMIIRFSAFHQAFRDGQFPVRWLGRLNQEYGYPVANFLYPGFMYLAEIPKVIGFNFVDSIKIILGLSLISSAVFSYLWLNKIFSKLSSFLGAIFYLYAPYHLWDVYKRGSVGEILALAVVPFILWTIERKNLFLYSMGIGLLILSHNTLAILFLPIIIIYGIFRKIIDTRYLILNTVLGFGLAAFFWLPAVYDLQYTRFFQTTVSNWQNYFSDLNLIGGATVIIFFLSVVLVCRCFLDTYHVSKIFFYFLLIGLVSIFLAIPQSAFLWKILPVFFIQFPFRFLSITILCGAFLTAFVTDKMGKLKIPLILILITMIFFSAKFYFQPTVFFDKGEGFYATNEGTTTVQDEYLPVWVKEKPIVRAIEKVEIISGKGRINNLQINSKKINFEISAQTESEIRINTFYFPGWMIRIDGQSAIIKYSNKEGLMNVIIPSGNHLVVAEFQEASFRLIADLISLISLIGLATLFLKKNE